MHSTHVYDGKGTTEDAQSDFVLIKTVFVLSNCVANYSNKLSLVQKWDYHLK